MGRNSGFVLRGSLEADGTPPHAVLAGGRADARATLLPSSSLCEPSPSLRRHLGLDLVPRKEFEMVDPDQISISELYKLVGAVDSSTKRRLLHSAQAATASDKSTLASDSCSGFVLNGPSVALSHVTASKAPSCAPRCHRAALKNTLQRGPVSPFGRSGCCC